MTMKSKPQSLYSRHHYYRKKQLQEETNNEREHR
jgi:hypothetical protein